MADRTFLRSIGGVNVDQWNASYGSLVGHELSELVETPRMVITSLRPLNRCPLSDSLKILEGDQRKGVFSLRNQCLGDAMVSVSSEPCHSARQLLEMSLSRFSPNALEFGLKSIRFSPNILDFLTRMYLSIAIYGQILDAEINTKNPNGIVRSCNRRFDHNTKVENAFDKDQISLTPNPIHPGLLVFSKSDRDSLPTLERDQGDLFKPFPGKDTLIVDDSAIKPKLRFSGFVSLVGFTDLGNGSDSKLCGEPKMFSNRIVNGLMDLNLVGTVHCKNSLSNVVTSLVKPLHCFTEHLMLLWRRIELYHQGLKHSIECYLQ